MQIKMSKELWSFCYVKAFSYDYFGDNIVESLNSI